MSDEIPFKFVRYQNTDDGVFDHEEDVHMSSRECAMRLNGYLRTIGKRDDEIMELHNEIKRLRLKNKELEIAALNATLAVRELERKELLK